MKNAIVNIFDQPPPEEVLYHYTSADGLKGMLGGRTLWATNIEYLNDITEFRHGELVINEIVKRRKRGAKGDRGAFFKALDEFPSIFGAEDVFVVSLSEAPDLLSQWRGYTPSNCGFNIGFDPAALIEAARFMDNMQLVQCIYDERKQKEFANSLLDSFLDMWLAECREGNPEEAVQFKKNLFPIICFRISATFAAASMKHHTFSEEREWRLLGVCRQPDRHRFRIGKSSLTPYIEIKWGDESEAPKSQPIRSVSVGPCPDPGASKRSISMLLRSCDVSGVSVQNSEIPFRSW